MIVAGRLQVDVVKLHLEMQLVRGVNVFLYRVRTGGQIQFCVRVVPDQLFEVRCEKHERKPTCAGTATVALMTENQKRTENRMDQVEEAIRQTQTDAEEDRADVLTVDGETPRVRQWES